MVDYFDSKSSLTSLLHLAPFALLFLLYKHLFPSFPSKTVPGPPNFYSLPPLSLFGVLPLIMSKWDEMPDFLLLMDRKYGRTWGGPVPNLGVMRGSIYCLVGEAQIKHVLKDNFNNYIKGANFQEALEEFLGKGIFNSDGDLWKHHRKIASNMFSRNLMRHGTLTAHKQVANVLKYLRNHAGTKEQVNLQDIFFKMTIDIFSEIAFGVELNSILSTAPHPFAEAFDTVQDRCQKRFKYPQWKAERFLQSCERERTITEKVKVINSFAEKVINSRRREAENDKNLGPDLLSRFLQKDDNDNDKNKNENKNDEDDPPMTSKQLRDIVMNFMIAGRDTTACALSWTMYELKKNPRCVAKIIEEVKGVFPTGIGDVDGGEGGGGDDDVDGEGSSSIDKLYSHTHKLKYTHAVVTEALRLHPSVPTDMKFAVDRDVLPDGTVINKGGCVLYSPYAMGRSFDVWGKDAEEFKPERFLGEGTFEPTAYKYPVFNAGYRLCLGKNLAYLEIKLALAMILPEFDFGWGEGGEHQGKYQSTLVLPMKPGLVMTVEKRG